MAVGEIPLLASPAAGIARLRNFTWIADQHHRGERAGDLLAYDEPPDQKIPNQVPGPALIDAVVAHLADASLLTFSLGGSTVSAHRLTMRVIREQRDHDGTLPAVGAIAITVLQTMARMLTPVRQHPQLAKDLTQHIIALTGHLAPGTDENTAGRADALLRLRGWAIACLNDLGDYPAQAISIAQELAADSERILGADHRLTVAARSNLANAYREAGRTAETIVLHEQTLSNRERVLGADDTFTAAARSNLANAYREAGRAAEATALCEQILARRERTLGGNHPSTADARKNLDYARKAQGRAAEVVSWYEQILADREQAFGSNHPDTLTAQNNLANAFRDAGRIADAIALHELTLARREQTLGSKHPDTVNSRYSLAYAYRTAGRLADAIAAEHPTETHPAQGRIGHPPDKLTTPDDLANA
jgi:hypothetical protein